MPKWNTPQAAFSPLNRHTVQKLRCFDMKQESHLQLAWFNVSLDYVVNYTTDARG
jgi:hypothetical protein